MRCINKNQLKQVLPIFMGLLVLLAMVGQPVQAREGDGAATGLDVQADTDAPLVGLDIDLTAARVDEGPTPAPFDESAQVLGLDAVSSTITADAVNAATQHQPFLNQVDSSASTTNLAILLNLLGVNLVDLDSTTIASDARVTGSCGAFTASGGTTIEDLDLSVLGQSVAANLTATPDPDTELLNTNIVVDLAGGLTTLSADALVILNEQTVAGDQSSIDVNALRIFLDITVSGLTNLTQTVEIIVARSETAFANCNDVNLEVEKTTSLAGNATVNVPFDYTVTITETSNNADATAVQFTDTLDTETTFQSFIDQGGGSCTHDSGTITCQWLTVPAGGSVSATYRVNPTTTGTATNGVTVTTGDNDTDPGDNSDSVEVVIDPAGGTTTDLAVGFVNSTPADGQVGVAQDVEINVTNTGAEATNATLVYTVSPDVTIGTITDPIFGNCVAAGNTVTCGPTNLANGTDDTLTIEVTPTTVGTNTHTVNVTSDVPDDDLTNNTDEVTVNVTAADSDVDLQVTVTDSPDPGTEGEPVTYTIDITNDGTDDAENVVLDVDLGGVPVAIDSATPDQGSCTISGTEVSCDLGTVGAGGAVQVEIVAIPNGTGTLTLTGTVEDDAGNSAPVSEDTTIQAAQADLSITKTADASEVTVGEQITYTIMVINDGPNAASNVVVSDTLPDQVTFVSAVPDQGGCNETAGVVTCNLGTLNDGDTVNIDLVVEAIGSGTASNTASVTSDTDDPDTDNNISDPADTTVNVPDLTVMLDGPTAGVVGRPVQYTATITNNEDNPVANVTLDIVIPDGLTVDSIDDAAGGSCSIGSITCTGLSVPANGSVDIVFTLTPDTGGQQLIEATVGTAADPDLDSDRLQILVLVVPLEPEPQSIPTLSEYGLMLMLALMVLLMLRTGAGTRRH